MIVIDPVITDTARMAEFHLRVRPGTDAWCLAAMAAVLVQGRPQDAAGPGLQGALAAALSVHALSKCAVAWASGGWHYAVAAGGGVLLHTGVFVAVLSLV